MHQRHQSSSATTTPARKNPAHSPALILVSPEGQGRVSPEGQGGFTRGTREPPDPGFTRGTFLRLLSYQEGDSQEEDRKGTYGRGKGDVLMTTARSGRTSRGGSSASMHAIPTPLPAHGR